MIVHTATRTNLSTFRPGNKIAIPGVQSVPATIPWRQDKLQGSDLTGRAGLANTNRQSLLLGF